MKKNIPMPVRVTSIKEMPDDEIAPDETLPGEKLQKVLAQAGFGSRRLMEEWIASGRVSVNGEPATLGMRVVEGDLVKAERRTIRVGEKDRDARVLLYHKPEGEIVSRDDPEKRASVFDKLPKLRGQKWIAVGRLDFNTSGLLIFTTSGELANRLMHPRFEIEREYAVRVQGTLTEAQMDQVLKQGVELEDGLVKFEKLEDQGGEGFNHWYRVMLKEGRNRVVRRTFDALDLPVSRLMRIRFGIINLPPRLKRGMTAELGADEVAQVLEWVGITADGVEPLQEVQASRPLDTAPARKSGRPAAVAKPASRPGSATRNRAPATGSKKSKFGIKH
ncbi:MAG: pseudouridine synthase [Nitrosomonadales bacterium]|nr:pseudouridine synthase [Nitrosomonadales bacterium]